MVRLCLFIDLNEDFLTIVGRDGKGFAWDWFVKGVIIFFIGDDRVLSDFHSVDFINKIKFVLLYTY